MGTAKARPEDLNPEILDELGEVALLLGEVEPLVDVLRARFNRYQRPQDRQELVKAIALREKLNAKWDVLMVGVDMGDDESEAA